MKRFAGYSHSPLNFSNATWRFAFEVDEGSHKTKHVGGRRVSSKSKQPWLVGLVLCLGSLVCAVRADAQARSLELGQAVEVFCNCFGPNAWVPGRIESIDENGYVVRYGSGRYQTKTVKFGSDRIRDPNQPVVPEPRVESSATGATTAVNGGSNQASTPEAGFNVGDEVELSQWSSGWIKARIESMDDRDYKVRFGPGTYNFVMVSRANPALIRDPKKAAVVAGQRQLHEAFMSEAKEFRPYVYAFRHVYHEELKPTYGFSPAATPAERQQAVRELARLDTLCKSKYAGMTDNLTSSRKDMLEERPAVWCEIAANRSGFEKAAQAHTSNEALRSFSRSFVDDIESAKDAPGDKIKEEIQIIVFERERWVGSLATAYARFFQDAGVAPSPQLFKDVFAKADELKAKIEAEAPTRSWDSPTLHNPALEGFVRNYYASYRKGVQILKIGMTMNAFRTFKNSLGIPTSQVISGSALVKVPNRPFCQNQVFELKKEYLGGGRFSAVQSSYIGVEGTFVKCQ
jgi:hypothetical protein